MYYIVFTYTREHVYTQSRTTGVLKKLDEREFTAKNARGERTDCDATTAAKLGHAVVVYLQHSSRGMDETTGCSPSHGPM